MAKGLSRVGYPVVAVTSRSAERRLALASALPDTEAIDSPQQVADASDIVFLTVADDAIGDVAASIVWRPNQAVVHCSGAASIDLLGPAVDAGAEAGVLHPLQTFADAETAERNLPGSPFGIEASAEALAETLSAMAKRLGGTPLLLAGEKAIYHASAVIASNYLVTLLDVASGLWTQLGVTQRDGLNALLPLVRGTIDNLDAVGLPDALTGPIARGDVGTVERHLAALARVAPDVLPVYKMLARRTLPVATARGTLSEESAQHIREVLRGGHGEESM